MSSATGLRMCKADPGTPICISVPGAVFILHRVQGFFQLSRLSPRHEYTPSPYTPQPRLLEHLTWQATMQLQRRTQQARTGAPRVQCRPSPRVRCRAAAPADTASKTVADIQAAIISLSGSKYGHDLSDDTRQQVCGCMHHPACRLSPCRASAGRLEQSSGCLDPLFLRRLRSERCSRHTRFASRPIRPGCPYRL
jgi:hypothetical protein